MKSTCSAAFSKVFKVQYQRSVSLDDFADRNDFVVSTMTSATCAVNSSVTARLVFA